MLSPTALWSQPSSHYFDIIDPSGDAGGGVDVTRMYVESPRHRTLTISVLADAIPSGAAIANSVFLLDTNLDSSTAAIPVPNSAGCTTGPTNFGADIRFELVPDFQRVDIFGVGDEKIGEGILTFGPSGLGVIVDPLLFGSDGNLSVYAAIGDTTFDCTSEGHDAVLAAVSHYGMGCCR